MTRVRILLRRVQEGSRRKQIEKLLRPYELFVVVNTCIKNIMNI